MQKNNIKFNLNDLNTKNIRNSCDSGLYSKVYFEKDDRGRIQNTLEKAELYWFIERVHSPLEFPFILYKFNNEQDAKKSLLELPCIFETVDTKRLICTETFIYGYYEALNGYEAILCGGDMTIELWELAQKSFEKFGGIQKATLRPNKHELPASKERLQLYKIKYLREDRSQFGTITYIYKVYHGPNAVTAKEFLSQNPVNRPYYYICVETPEGNYCRDIDGMYKEPVSPKKVNNFIKVIK